MSSPNTKNLLIIGYVWPEPGSSAAGSRMMNLISSFEQEGWDITFACSAAPSEFATDFEALGIKTISVNINDSAFDAVLRELAPDVVMFDRFVVEEQFGWRVAEQCPNALRILDTEDLHCLRRARKKAVNQERDFNPEELLEDEVAMREIASIYRCDLSLIISDFEMDLLTNLFGVDQALLHYLPFMLDPITDEDRNQWPPFEKRKNFMTIGNFRHPPNWDSVRYLRSEVWPLVRRQLPRAELHIYGAYPSQKVSDLHKPKEGFYIKGRAEEARQVIQQARIMLAPLRFGAGLKGKLVEAMQYGTPSVTTPVGAEGLQGDMPWGGSVCRHPEEIAQSAVKLYRDKKVWKEAQQLGVEIINARFAPTRFKEQVHDKVNYIFQNFDKHRRNNFIGRMLLNHTAASTRYMAKWIEEKNR